MHNRSRRLWSRRDFCKSLGLSAVITTLAPACRRIFTGKKSLACSHLTELTGNGPIPCSQPLLLSDGISAERPNVILFYIDDLDDSELSVTRGRVMTPNIDCLAQNGMQFLRAYTTSPVCTPSRYSLLTGQYASRCRKLKQDLGDEPANVQWNTMFTPGDLTVANVLKLKGYTTGMVGKWHLDGGIKTAKLSPSAKSDDPATLALIREAYDESRQVIKDNYGFDYVESFYQQNIDGMVKGGHLPASFNFHNMEWITQGALDFIEQNKERPFFLYFATTLPHVPDMLKSLKANPRITPIGMLKEPLKSQPSRKSVLERTKQAGLPEEAAPYTWLDDGVGAVLAKLDELGLTKDTIIFFLSDHQNGGKFTLYEAGAKIPCFIRWPQKIAPESRYSKIVANIDIAPTIFDICGAERPINMVMDGKSLLPILTNEDDSALHESLLMEIGYARGVVNQDWKYISVSYPEDIQQRSGTDSQQPLSWDGKTEVRYKSDKCFPGYFDQEQLYSLNKDSREQNNLASVASYKDKVEEMRDLLKKHLQTLQDA